MIPIHDTLEKANYRDGKIVGGEAGARMNGWITENFQDSEYTLYIIMMDICHYTFSQTSRKYNILSEL